MPIELEKDDREAAIASIRRYADENLEEPLGSLAAGLLLEFFLEEIAPLAYNRAVRDVQARLQAQLTEIDLEVNEEEFGFSRSKGWK